MPSSPALSVVHDDLCLSPRSVGDQLVLHVRGSLDASTTPMVRAAMDKVDPRPYRAIVLDASELDMIDSVGVGLIVALYKRARLVHTSVTITGLRHQPHAILKLLRLDRLFAPAA